MSKQVRLCDFTSMGVVVFKAVFLTTFYRFLRLSNLAPHSRSMFDPTGHITTEEPMFSKKFVKIIVKWSKTNQNRNKVHILTLPTFKGSVLCPHEALKAI